MQIEDFESILIHSQNWQQHSQLLQALGDVVRSDDREASKNLLFENWPSTPSSLMHTLAIQKRYDPPMGQFCMIHQDRIPVATGGCYLSDWSSSVMTIGVRTWTNPRFRYRWWHGEYLLPEQIRHAQQLGCVAAVFTFNDYSLPLKIFLKRITQNKAVSLGSKNAEFYQDIIFYEQPFLIKNVSQTIAVKLIDCDQKTFEEKYLPPLFKSENTLGI